MLAGKSSTEQKLVVLVGLFFICANTTSFFFFFVHNAIVCSSLPTKAITLSEVYTWISSAEFADPRHTHTNTERPSGNVCEMARTFIFACGWTRAATLTIQHFACVLNTDTERLCGGGVRCRTSLYSIKYTISCICYCLCCLLYTIIHIITLHIWIHSLSSQFILQYQYFSRCFVLCHFVYRLLVRSCRVYTRHAHSHNAKFHTGIFLHGTI